MDNLDKSPGAVSADTGALVWDCGSSLYDSFELTSFRRQLNAAITSARCLSMPHGPHGLSLPATATSLEADRFQKKQSRLSKSMRKLIRSVLRSKPAAGSRLPRQTSSKHSEDDFYAASSDIGGFGSTPEVCEKNLNSPESNTMVRRAESQRFAAPTTAGGAGGSGLTKLVSTS